MISAQWTHYRPKRLKFECKILTVLTDSYCWHRKTFVWYTNI